MGGIRKGSEKEIEEEEDFQFFSGEMERRAQETASF